MKTQQFLDLISQHQDKKLLFQYAPNMLVGANYHLTEVKNITVKSVDCGAQADNWNETIVQIWESPMEIGKTEFLSTFKALAILKKVDGITKMDRDAIIKFEYGNTTFHTAQLNVIDYIIKGNNLIVNLTSQPTDCKAKELCGIPEETELQTNACTPGGGCC